MMSPKNFPPPPAPGTLAALHSELRKRETWELLAERVGRDEAQKLHERLVNKRPQGPRSGVGHLGDPLVRNSDPL